MLWEKGTEPDNHIYFSIFEILNSPGCHWKPTTTVSAHQKSKFLTLLVSMYSYEWHLVKRTCDLSLASMINLKNPTHCYQFSNQWAGVTDREANLNGRVLFELLSSCLDSAEHMPPATWNTCQPVALQCPAHSPTQRKLNHNSKCWVCGRNRFQMLLWHVLGSCLNFNDFMFVVFYFWNINFGPLEQSLLHFLNFKKGNYSRLLSYKSHSVVFFTMSFR